MADDLAGDWYLFLGEGVPNPAMMPRYTLRAGKVFHGAEPTEVGTYEVTQGLLEVTFADGSFVGRQVDPTDATLSGTFVDEAEDGTSEPALLLRATEQPTNH